MVPSSMVHLITAYKYNKDVSMTFLVGNIVPDIVKEWKEKDRIHLRDREDRLFALEELAGTLNLQDDFKLGILLHLFLDYKWDTYPRVDFIMGYEDYTWFHPYRHEMALVGGWLYHHTDWSKGLWEEMKACPLDEFENSQGYNKEEIAKFISHNYEWHEENDIGPSSFFTPELIEEFTSEAADDFRSWLADL
jgi:hypothetical protein